MRIYISILSDFVGFPSMYEDGYDLLDSWNVFIGLGCDILFFIFLVKNSF